MFGENFIWEASVLLINLVLAAGLLMGLRLLKGVFANVDTTHELAGKDNSAFGIALAGGVIALTTMMTGVLSGEASIELINEVLNIAMYSLVGLALIMIGRVVNDKLIFNRFSLKEQIHNQNIAAAVVEAANMIALGIVIRAAMLWVEAESYNGLIPVAIIFVISQIILLLVTRIRQQIYKSRHAGALLQSALESGHVPLSIRYFGHVIGAALAVSAAGGLVVYLPTGLYISVYHYAGVAAVLVLFLSLISAIIRMGVLKGIDVVEEVDEQKNVGVACIEAAIFVSVGLLFVALLG